jgi:hypothetical protein
MSANIGPAKSAVLVFAPQFAPPTNHELRWDSTPLPMTSAYRYLGVKLHEDCTWQAHIQHAADKGRAASYAAAGVLHNRRLHLAVRRMVLLSVVRPTMDYAATVWHGTDQELAKIEQVQTRVLRRFTATGENLADDVLRCEFACRHTKHIGQQRKLEFAYELSGMQPNRLPSQLARCDWGKNSLLKGRARPKMHADVTGRIAKAMDLDPAAAAADPEQTKSGFKTAVRTAVLKTAMQEMVAKHTGSAAKSTVANYLRLLDPAATEFPNNLPDYLDTVMHRGAQLKLLFRAGFAPVASVASRKTKTSASCVFCQCGADETAAHFVFECPAYAAQRQAALTELRALVGRDQYREWLALSGADKLSAVLSDNWWGRHMEAGDDWTQHLLLELEAARKRLASQRTCTLTAGAGARAHGFGYG